MGGEARKWGPQLLSRQFPRLAVLALESCLRSFYIVDTEKGKEIGVIEEILLHRR